MWATMKQLCFYFLCFIGLQAQNSFETQAVDNILSSAVNILSQSKSYFVGQADANQANTIIERGLLFA
jgi:hypothetical protein